MTIKKLTRMPYAQAHVEIYDGTISLFSYVTLVADIDKDGWLKKALQRLLSCLRTHVTS